MIGQKRFSTKWPTTKSSKARNNPHLRIRRIAAPRKLTPQRGQISESAPTMSLQLGHFRRVMAVTSDSKRTVIYDKNEATEPGRTARTAPGGPKGRATASPISHLAILLQTKPPNQPGLYIKCGRRFNIHPPPLPRKPTIISICSWTRFWLVSSLRPQPR